MEDNLRITSVWEQNGDIDPPTGDGLEVHMGGDYRVASAYMIRGDGSVRESDGSSCTSPPYRQSETSAMISVLTGLDAT